MNHFSAHDLEALRREYKLAIRDLREAEFSGSCDLALRVTNALRAARWANAYGEKLLDQASTVVGEPDHSDDHYTGPRGGEADAAERHSQAEIQRTLKR